MRQRSWLTAAGLLLAATAGMAQQFDKTTLYYLSNDFLGANKVLAVAAGGSPELQMQNKSGASGQMWYVRQTPYGIVLHSKQDGWGWALKAQQTSINFWAPIMAETNAGVPAGDILWTFTSLGGGAYRIASNAFAGRSLDTSSDATPFVGLAETAPASGQFWHLTPANPVVTPTVTNGTFYRIKTNSGGNYLRQTGPGTISTTTTPSSNGSDWTLEPLANDYPMFRLKNRLTGQYLNTETGSLQAGTIQGGWYSAMWFPESYGSSGYVWRNRWTADAIVRNGGGSVITQRPARGTDSANTWLIEAVVPCTYQMATNVGTNSGANAGSGSILLTTQAGCPWTASSNAAWVTVAPGSTSGTGTAQVTLNWTANPSPAPRSAIITIAGTQVTFTQVGIPCTYQMATNVSTNSGANAGSGSILLTTTAGCPWTASSNSAWVTIAPGSTSGTGTAQVVLNWTANPTANTRTAILTIAGTQVNFSQAGAQCTYSLSPASVNMASGGGNGSTQVTTITGCNWTATSGAAWVSIISGANGSGNGAVSFNVQVNNDSQPRTGVLTIGGQTFTIVQAGTGPCNYTLSPASASVSASGGSGTFALTTGSNCAWTTFSVDTWINVTSGLSGTGTSNISFVVSANPGNAARVGLISVGSQVFTINQAGGTESCTLTLGSLSANLPASGGNQAFSFSTGSSCGWTATTTASWIIINAGFSGSGPGSVTFMAMANPGANARTGVITVGTQTYTVVQQGQSAGNLSAPLRFVAMAPCRIMETRAEYNFEGRTGAFGPPFLNRGDTRTMTVPASSVCQVPATAKAYVLNVTLVPRGSVDFVTIWPAGETRPDFWTVRSPDGKNVANSAIVKAGTGNGISVYASDATDMVVDISGYFTDSPTSNLVFYPLTPCRVIDTRMDYRPAGDFGGPSMPARETRRFRFPSTPYCTVPQGAAAYSVTITVAPPGPLAYLTAWPSGGSQPNVSNINSPAGRVLANSVILPTSADGSVDVFVFDRSDFIIDINGYFAPDDGVNGLFYYPVTQCRATDSSNAAYGGIFGGPMYADDTKKTIPVPASPFCSGIPTNARAYSLNVTALPNGSPMPFLTAYPAGQPRPNASILNAFEGQIVSNSAIVPAGPDGSIEVYAYRRTNVVVEVAGYFGR